MILKAVYFDQAEERIMGKFHLVGEEFDLTESQAHILCGILKQIESNSQKNAVIPIYIDAETGSGKTHLAIELSNLIFQKMSKLFSKIHSIYLSPTTFLAEQAANRFTTKLNQSKVDMKMISLKGSDENKKDRVKDVFSIYLQDNNRMLATNPQFLSSLCSKSILFYNIESRSADFELVKTLADTNLIIIDEPHFYKGKSIIRLLTLLLHILNYKKFSAPSPTVVLFLSATMSANRIDKTIYELNSEVGIGLNLSKSPVDQRILKIEEKEKGDKWSLFLEMASFNQIFNFVLAENPVTENSIVFWDNIPAIVSLQEFLSYNNIDSAILHAQMPQSVKERNKALLKDENSKILLTTSMSEIGIEFEKLNFPISKMFSINTRSVSTLLQRMGRLARRKNTSGVLYNIDLQSHINPLGNLFENNLEYESDHKEYPSLLEKAKEFDDSFFTGYLSQDADRAFSDKLANAIDSLSGEVFPIYISNSVKIDKRPSNFIDFEDDDKPDSLYIPFYRVSGGAFKISIDEYLEFFKTENGYQYQLRNGNIQVKPFLITKITVNKAVSTKRKRQLTDKKLLDVWNGWKLMKICLLDAKVQNIIPGTDQQTINGLVIQMNFKGEVYPKDASFLSSEFYEEFLDLIWPVDSDLQFYWKARHGEPPVNDCLYCYEFESGTLQHPLRLGAVEKLWYILTGE